jgi:hypothetical protein
MWASIKKYKVRLLKKIVIFIKYLLGFPYAFLNIKVCIIFIYFFFSFFNNHLNRNSRCPNHLVAYFGSLPCSVKYLVDTKKTNRKFDENICRNYIVSKIIYYTTKKKRQKPIIENRSNY